MNIFLIEDNAAFAGEIKIFLHKAGHEVIHVTGDLAGKRLATKRKFDFYLIGSLLPGVCALQLCREIKREIPAFPVIVLVEDKQIESKLNAFEAGCDDVLIRPFDNRELLARLNAILRRYSGKGKKPVMILRSGDLKLDLRTKTANLAGNVIMLTGREFTLLEFLMQNEGVVISRELIAEKAWFIENESGINLVGVYINALRKKIEFQGYKFVHTRTGMGYLFKQIREN